ncbi:MAG: benzoylsuccinyl-CoA thiolase [Gammaproteobacteria bacterium]|nr:MAG: benzoylsuccinyl-CoA thiolase [Gammaproteobacteria bacterium]
MTEQKKVEAALEGWFTLDRGKPHLLGTKCTCCGTYYFPKQSTYCKNPECDSEEFEEVQLSRKGKVWSFTNACYKPPEPFVAAEPFEPYTIAAVELEREKMIVLGQVVTGVEVADLKAGMEMELVLDTLFETDEAEKLTWKWQPVSA